MKNKPTKIKIKKSFTTTLFLAGKKSFENVRIFFGKIKKNKIKKIVYKFSNTPSHGYIPYQRAQSGTANTKF